MGGCVSCRSSKNHKNLRKSELSENDFLKIILELNKKHEFSIIPKSENKDRSDVNEEVEEVPTGMSFSDEFAKNLLLQWQQYELDIAEEENDYYGSQTLISKSISHTSEPGAKDSKRKKSQKLTENYKNNPTLCKSVGLEESYHIDEPRTHKLAEKNSFLKNPLTVEEVNEVLDNPDSNLSLLFPLSIDSSLITELSHSNELTDFLDYYTNSSESPIDGTDQNPTPINTDDKYEQHTNVDNKKHTESEGIGLVLNAVPKSYESFAKIQKPEPEIDNEAQNVNDKNELDQAKTRELFNLLLQVNQYKQNIIHQLVLSQNYSGIVIVFECLAELETLNELLESADKFSNTPFAYALITGDLKMTKILLKFNPKLPKFCYFKTKDDWVPILHMAYQFVRDDEDNFITLICNYILSAHNKEMLKDTLEVKNKMGLTILHHIIVHYIPKKNGIDMKNVLNSQFYLNYLINIGANLESKCFCPSKKQIKVDALGQIVFSKYPLELLTQLMEYKFINDIGFTWEYVIDNISYKLDELFLLRTDISLEYKENAVKILEKFK